MSRRTVLLVLNGLLALALSVALATPAAGAQARQRCCFFLKADSDASVKETFTNRDTPRGEQQGSVSWLLIGIFRYREQGGFADLVNIGPAHEHGIRFTKDEIRSYAQLQNPPDTVGTPVAEPGTCGVLKRKRIERSPRVDLFRGNIDVNVFSYEDVGCMYGLSMINWDVAAEGDNYAPWSDSFRAPPRRFFRRGRGTYRRETGFHSTYSPNHDFGIDAEYDHNGFLTIEWFPQRALQNRLKQIQRYHENYDFEDLCSHIPCG